MLSAHTHVALPAVRPRVSSTFTEKTRKEPVIKIWTAIRYLSNHRKKEQHQKFNTTSNGSPDISDLVPASRGNFGEVGVEEDMAPG